MDPDQLCAQTHTDEVTEESELARRLEQLEVAFANNVQSQQGSLVVGDSPISPSPHARMSALEDILRALRDKVLALEAKDDPKLKYQIAMTVCCSELRCFEQTLLDAQDFFHHGGLGRLVSAVDQARDPAGSQLTLQEKQEWIAQHQEAHDLFGQLMTEQADLATNVKDLSARAAQTGSGD